MFKRILAISLFSLCIMSPAFSQSPAPGPNPNAEHDRLYYLMKKSENVVIPDSIIVLLKRYAAAKNINESIVLKNSIFLKTVYNENLSAEERIDACKFGLRIFSNEDEVLPLYIFSNMIKKLEINK